MEKNELNSLLDKLHSQIEQTSTLGQAEVAKLRDLEVDIRALLDRAQGQTVEPQTSLLQQLEEDINVFEATHPTLSSALSEVMAILSNAGI